MFLHHVATISLITFSYVNNMARVGTLVMCLHDAADVLIEVRIAQRAEHYRTSGTSMTNNENVHAQAYSARLTPDSKQSCGGPHVLIRQAASGLQLNLSTFENCVNNVVIKISHCQFGKFPAWDQ